MGSNPATPTIAILYLFIFGYLRVLFVKYCLALTKKVQVSFAFRPNMETTFAIPDSARRVFSASRV